MLNLLVGTVLLIACSAPFILREIAREVTLPSQVGYLLDFAIAGASAVVIVRLVANGGWSRIPIVLVLAFLGFLYVAITGVLINDLSSLVAFAGVRSYFRFVPVFLIPFAFIVSDPEFRVQLKYLAGLFLLQLPVALYQRFLTEEAEVDALGDGMSGDLVTGTFTTSSSVSVLCAGAIAVLAAFHIRGRIRLPATLALALIFLVPTAIAETKATPIFLALGGMGVIFVLYREMAIKRLVTLLFAGVALIGAFAISYDQLYSDSRGVGYFQYMTDTNRTIDNYNLQGAQAKPLSALEENSALVAQQVEVTTTDTGVGRLDGFRLPFDSLWPKDVLRLFMGLGIGNVDSTFGPGGNYRNIKRQLGGSDTSLAMLLWETGLVGTSLFVVFSLLITREFQKLASNEGIMGALGAGMFGFSLIFLFSLAYFNVFHHAEILVIYCYLGGVAAAYNQRLRFASHTGYAERYSGFIPVAESGHRPT